MNKVLKTKERIANIVSFLNKSNKNGPIYGFHLGGYFPLQKYKHVHPILGKKDLRPDEINIDGILKDYEKEYRQNINMPGSSIWSAEILWSIPWFEAILGARVETSKTGYAAIAHMQNDIYELAENGNLKINLDWENTLIEYIKKAVNFSNGKFPVAAPLLRGPSDIIAFLFGYDNVIYKIFDEPNLIKKILDKITNYYLELWNKIFKVLPLYHNGSFIYCRNIWMPRRSFVFQEDAAGSILSPDIFKDFIVNQDQKILSLYPNTFYHLHSGTYKILLKNLLNEVNVKVIEIWMDRNGPEAKELTNDFKYILDSNKSLYIWAESKIQEIPSLLKNIPYNGKGVFIEFSIFEREEAEEIINLINNYFN